LNNYTARTLFSRYMCMPSPVRFCKAHTTTHRWQKLGYNLSKQAKGVAEQRYGQTDGRSDGRHGKT